MGAIELIDAIRRLQRVVAHIAHDNGAELLIGVSRETGLAVAAKVKETLDARSFGATDLRLERAGAFEYITVAGVKIRWLAQDTAQGEPRG